MRFGEEIQYTKYSCTVELKSISLVSSTAVVAVVANNECSGETFLFANVRQEVQKPINWLTTRT